MRGLLTKLWIVPIAVLAAAALSTPTIEASTVAIGIGAFGSGSILTNFNGLASGTEVNGLTVGGIQFSYSLGDDQLEIDGGPGTTNNIDEPNIVSIGNNAGILSLLFSSNLDSFGYGYALLNTVNVPNATTISLFQGVTPVGSLSYNGVLDPVFAGGFAGIQSTTPFNRAQLTFNSASAPAFALDNIRTLATPSTTVPEPSSLLLIGTGITSLLVIRRKRTQS